MRDMILDFQNQIKKGVEATGDFKLDKKYDHYVICGMGGSIIPGTMYLTWQEHQNKDPGVPVIINENYDLPSDINSKDLVICISWSGTTEETISACQTATKRGINAIAITKGDKLEQLAKDNNLVKIILPNDNIPPRLAIGYMTAVLFSILGYGKELDFKLDASTQEEAGKKLAEKIGSKIPLIYTSYSWRKLGAFWKANFNETSKAPAYWNYTPSMAHNELAMYAQKGLPFYPIIFRGANDEIRHTRDLNNTIAICTSIGEIKNFNHYFSLVSIL